MKFSQPESAKCAVGWAWDVGNRGVPLGTGGGKELTDLRDVAVEGTVKSCKKPSVDVLCTPGIFTQSRHDLTRRVIYEHRSSIGNGKLR
jgi:hypothetical protein